MRGTLAPYARQLTCWVLKDIVTNRSNKYQSHKHNNQMNLVCKYIISRLQQLKGKFTRYHVMNKHFNFSN